MLFIKGSAKVARQVMITAGVVNAFDVLNLPADVVITSGMDGQHRPHSKHYTGEALDFRTKLVDHDRLADLVKMVKARLGHDYDVILEDIDEPNEHLHVEYDPKR